jgi:hypothetical protein
MYRKKNREQKYLFKELMPFGGRLDEANRWLKIKSLIPWDELEGSYAEHFAEGGRPALDGRMVMGLLLLKHMTKMGDREVQQSLRENVYWQAFCGFEHFMTEKQLNASSLSKIRKVLGPEFVRELEEKTYKILIERKIIRSKGVLVDGTVIPEKIRHPNDVGLLNEVREWAVKKLREISRKTGEKIRTYRRKAKKSYLKFSKTKRKTREMIKRARREMLQFTRRNLEQLRERLAELDERQRREVEELLKVATMIYEQQIEMHRRGVNRIENRTVSFWREYVRPIKRGKGGPKETEFGPKVSVSHVDGFAFVDAFGHDNYSEADPGVVEKQLDNYEKKFGKAPPSLTGDQLYGSRANRKILEKRKVRGAFRRLGRACAESRQQEQYVRRKQRERNRVEGSFGNGKEHYGLDGIRYHGRDGSEMWVRLGFLGMNLKAALARMS